MTKYKFITDKKRVTYFYLIYNILENVTFITL